MGGILRNQRTPPVGGLVRTKILVHSLHARARGRGGRRPELGERGTSFYLNSLMPYVPGRSALCIIITQ
jgi:hypothetical protein